MQKTLKLIMLFGAFFILIVSSWGEIGHIALIPLYLLLGFWFGKITCGHSPYQIGFWVSVLMFGMLNLIHATIDGVAISIKDSFWVILGVIIHELLRQLALYKISFEILKPFHVSIRTKWMISFITITGTSILGIIIGLYAKDFLNLFISHQLHEYLAGSIFFFGGDIIHHVWDEYVHTKTTRN